MTVLISSVVRNAEYEDSFHHKYFVHCTPLPRRLAMTSQWEHHSGITLECLECREYLICFVIHDVTGQWKWVKYRKLHFSYPNLVHWAWRLRWRALTKMCHILCCIWSNWGNTCKISFYRLHLIINHSMFYSAMTFLVRRSLLT